MINLQNIWPKRKKIWGLDIGTSGLKLAMVQKNKNTIKILDYRFYPLTPGTVIDGEIVNEEQFILDLQPLKEELPPASTSFVLGLSGHSTIVKKLHLSGKNEEELEDQVFWEIEQYLTYPPEEAYISFFNYGKNSYGTADVLIACAKKEMADKVIGLFEKIGHQIKVLDLIPIGLCNVFTFCLSKMDMNHDAAQLLLDIGAQQTHLLVVQQDQLFFHAELPFGSSYFSEEIQKKLGISFAEAENLKYSLSIGENVPQEVMDVMQKTLTFYALEIVKIIDMVRSQINSLSQKAFITGGGGLLGPLLAKFSEETQLECSYLDLKEFFHIPDSLLEQWGESLQFLSMASFGLAIRALHD